jgi:hypothetical protein
MRHLRHPRHLRHSRHYNKGQFLMIPELSVVIPVLNESPNI